MSYGEFSTDLATSLLKTGPGRLGTLPDANADPNLLVGPVAVDGGLRSGYLRDMLGIYNGLGAAAGGLPHPSSFNPVMAPLHLTSVFQVVLEPRPDGGHDYRYLLFGTSLKLLFGTSMAGKRVDDFPDQNRVARSRRILDHVAVCGVVCRTIGQFNTRNGLPVTGEALIMPFGTGGVVSHILADLDYDS